MPVLFHLKTVALATVLAIVTFESPGWFGPRFEEPGDQTRLEDPSTDNCASCHRNRADDATKLYAFSEHARNGITCHRCHGGDPFANDAAGAHRGRFIALPSPSQTVAMCGSCHREQAAQLRTGRHFDLDKNTPRVDCSQCHGAHSVGSPHRDFSFAYFCAGCHGLEYLPALPDDLRQILVLSDDLSEFWRHELTDRNWSQEIRLERKKMNKMIGEFVHAGRADLGRQRLSSILESGKSLKSMMVEGR